MTNCERAKNNSDRPSVVSREELSRALSTFTNSKNYFVGFANIRSGRRRSEVFRRRRLATLVKPSFRSLAGKHAFAENGQDYEGFKGKLCIGRVHEHRLWGGIHGFLFFRRRGGRVEPRVASCQSPNYFFKKGPPPIAREETSVPIGYEDAGTSAVTSQKRIHERGSVAFTRPSNLHTISVYVLLNLDQSSSSHALPNRSLTLTLDLFVVGADSVSRVFLAGEEKGSTMTKGSQSQASTTASSARGSAAGAALPRSASAGAPPKGTGGSGLRRRRTTSTGSGSGSGSYRSGNSNMLRFYTDDAPGLKITPTVVLVMSLCFIGVSPIRCWPCNFL
uniref:Protein transport protein Sec61 subunit beta n=1 Tax=Physcomitrium patens TaxID=3218 RepID=A0A7I4BCT0_PHYPA